MLVRQSHVVWMAILPSEEQPVLLVDPNAVLSFSMVAVLFEVISRYRGQISHRDSIIEQRKFSLQSLRWRILGLPRTVSIRGLLISEALDHVKAIVMPRVNNVKR